MFAKINSLGLMGLNAFPVYVEIEASKGMQSFDIVGLADAAVRCGIPRSKATLYASQTLLGSAKLQLTTGRHPEELKDAVCSPGGTTIAGVAALESGGFRAAVEDAVSAAYKRTLEL